MRKQQMVLVKMIGNGSKGHRSRKKRKKKIGSERERRCLEEKENYEKKIHFGP